MVSDSHCLSVVFSSVSSGSKRWSGPEGAVDLEFNDEDGIVVTMLGNEPQGWELSLKAGIWALRRGFEPQGQDLSLETGIWALKLGFEPLDSDLSLEIGI